jgi:hypothetical protein
MVMTTTGDSPKRRPARVDRRAVMAGGLGVLSGTLLAQAPPAQAANGEPVLLGQDNTETAPTRIRNLKADEVGLRVTAQGAGSTALEALSPNVALRAEGEQGTGVWGVSQSGDGVVGQSFFAAGVHGISSHGFGVVGDGELLAGVSGNSRFSSGVVGANVATDKPAVQGWAQNGSTGVQGISAGGEATPPISPNTGVHGVCDAADGIGVLAQSASGTALRVDGRAVFGRSGVLVIPARSRSATKAGIRLTRASLVLAILRQHQAGVHVEAAVPDPATGSFTVYLNRRVRRDIQVAWFVVN